MQSKATFDLDQNNSPVIKIQVTSTDDVRDKIAKRFTETFVHGDSQWCEILPSGEGEYLIWPIKPDELRKTAKYMMARADELEKHRMATKDRIESL